MDDATTNNTDTVELADLTNDGDHIVAGTVTHIQAELMSPAAQTLFNAAAQLMEGDKGPQDRLAYILYLDALIASPEAVRACLRTLRNRLAFESGTLVPPLR